MKLILSLTLRKYSARLFCAALLACGAGLFGAAPTAAQTSNFGKSSLPPEAGKKAAEKSSSASAALVFGQVNENFRPDPAKTVRLPRLTDAEKAPQTSRKKTQIGTVRKLGTPITRAGQGAEFALDGGRLTVFGIVSEAALQTRVRFSNMNLPAGAQVIVYSAADPQEVYGPYENTGDAASGDFWSPPIEGDNIVVEYYAPETTFAADAKLPFKIAEVSHIYRDFTGQSKEDSLSPPEFPCHNNVPTEWANVARSVGHIQFTSGGGEYICTGTMLNPIAGDYDPLFLTANHCIETEAEAQSLRVYWLYNTGDFPSGTLPRTNGATLLSTGAASDYTLMRLRGSVPLRQGITYSGWDANITPLSTAVAGIHHPRGSYKRFSTGTTFSNGNFIEVRWGSGITEGGSSGSGIWKGASTNAQLIGTLSNGTAGCVNPRDFYGNFNVTYQSISTLLQGGTDDALDAGGGNDTRATAVAIAPGTTANLIVKWQDSDWYAVTVPIGYKITATANFVHANGDIDLAIYKGSDATAVAVSNTAANTETVSTTATSGATTYYINAYLFDGARNEYSLNVALERVSGGTARPAFDFDGDGRSDIAVFRPAAGTWFVQNTSPNGYAAQPFGQNGDIIAPADFDGDGKTDFAVFRPSTGTWYRLNSATGNSFSFAQFGQAGDIPVPADYDGDGKADIAVFRPSSGYWYRTNSSNNAFVGVQFGAAEDKPVPADYDGDGKADITVFRPSSGYWYRTNSSNNAFAFTQFGAPEDKPVPADFDGDGKADVAVFRPSTGYWYRTNSSNNAFGFAQFGTAGDFPAPADYDGDGLADLAVFRPSANMWYLQRSQAGFAGIQFGQNGDTPAPSAFVR